jgi:hypothetical protein
LSSPEPPTDDAPEPDEAPGASDVPSPAWVLLTPLLPWLAALPGGSWALPLVAPFVIYPAFSHRVRDRRYGSAWGLAMLWAFLLSLGVIVLLAVRPAIAARGILHGTSYKEEMFGWIRTGVGRESTPSLFVPQHLIHLVAFMGLTVVSGGYLGLALGAFLMAYMSYFVGAFAVASGDPLAGAAAAWVPWSVVRVMAFVLLGTLLARPLLVRERWPFRAREGWLFALAFAGIAADLVLKTLLAPGWGQLLRRLLERQ